MTDKSETGAEGCEADGRFMRDALEEGERALRLGEVPVGAVIVRDAAIIGRGHNEVERRRVATAHAEMLAFEAAARETGDWRLDGSTLYVTVEPCHMCLGAAYLCRIARIVFGASQPRTGACGSAGDLHEAQIGGHRIEVTRGVLEKESLLLLQEFFTRLREA
ncbi:MAG: nucleoside deaminase [Candidatus Krumholzibacteria bacterium]|nr:nucleoside deaminase [Candidatus Krumholzibacteria bacterium]